MKGIHFYDEGLLAEVSEPSRLRSFSKPAQSDDEDEKDASPLVIKPRLAL